MSQQDLPQEPSPLSVWGYWRESVQAWADFSQRTTQIMISQMSQSSADATRQVDRDAEPLASELLRSLSDVNLRHWQNTARFLESLPNWMQLPHNMTGSALVDWFDGLPGKAAGAATTRAGSRAGTGDDYEAPKTLPTPEGAADDLTRIKGIGPKISARLNKLGIYHFRQIAEWSEPEARWVEEHLTSKGRVGRENWVSQARKLSANGAATVH